jgi:tRNA (adenine37-N6)-methyltransferase
MAPDKVEKGARHPRNRTDRPLVGIFAQRAKSRRNQIGVSRCRLLKVSGLSLQVEVLDAIDHTPVLNSKPYICEFGPRPDVKQPQWATEVMKNYYSRHCNRKRKEESFPGPYTLFRRNIPP